MQPLQYDLRSRAAKDNSITNAATARSNLDAAITMRSAKTELQNTIKLRATGSEIAGPKPDLSTPERKKDDFEALFTREAPTASPKSLPISGAENEDTARLTGTRIYIILLLGSLSNDCWYGNGTLRRLLDGIRSWALLAQLGVPDC